MKTAIKKSGPLDRFKNEGQKLGTILENKVPKISKFSKFVNNKSCSPFFISLNESKI